MANPANAAATCMEHLCDHDWHGYDQIHRNGDGEGVCSVTVGGRTYELQQGDRDCSSAIIECWRMALKGTPCEGVLDGATYTGNMDSVFLRSGLFAKKPMSYTAQRGDVYMKDGHTAMCVSVVPDLLAEFSINEKGTISGGQVGDQTGREAYVHAYYPGWDHILAYTGGDLGSASGKPSAAPEAPRYRVKTAEDGWLPWMQGLVSEDGSDEPFAGELGHAIIDFEWEAPDGSWFVQTLADGTELARNEHNTTDQPLSGITLYYVTPEPGVTGFYVAAYRVGVKGGQWLKMEYDDKDNGAGGAGAIDRLQLTIEPA